MYIICVLICVFVCVPQLVKVLAARTAHLEHFVASISQQATAEAIVETTLTRLVGSWKAVDLPLVNHGSTRLRSIMLLGELDTIFDLLEHSQMTSDMLRVSKVCKFACMHIISH